MRATALTLLSASALAVAAARAPSAEAAAPAPPSVTATTTGRDAGSAGGTDTRCLDVRDYGARGDNSQDDTGSFFRAYRDAAAQGKSICIPRGSYVLSKAWVISSPVDVFMEDSANLRFTNPASCGVVIDLRNENANYGLDTVRLGGLYSPAITAAFRFPGYPSAWRKDARSQCDGITLLGGSRIDVSAKYLLGWNAGIRVAASHDSINGARAPQNINIRVNTIDIVKYGIYIDAGPENAGRMSAIDAQFNTVFAKYPIYFDDRYNGISASTIRISGQAFTNEEGGACLYDAGRNGEANAIDINWCYAGFSKLDSPVGTDPNLTLPYVAGSTPSHGILTDGNATIGYWGSSRNQIRIGAAIDQRQMPGAFPPDAGRVTRVRDAGAQNDIAIRYLASDPAHALTLSSIEGENQFGGGIGSAGVASREVVEIPVKGLKSGASATYYYYNALLSSGSTRLVHLIPYDDQSASNGIVPLAIDNATKTNREVVITLANHASEVVDKVYRYWVVID
jgi:hypothetical protein